MIKTIRELDEDATSKISDDVSAGNCAGLFLVFTGTNQSGQTGDQNDMPTLTVRRNDETLIERPVGFFCDYWDYRAGSFLLDSTTAGAFKLAVVIPFWVGGSIRNPGIENAYFLKDSELDYKLDPNDDGTVFSALQVEVSKIVTGWDENYLFKAMGADQDVTSGMSSRKFDLPRRNIAEVLVRDSNTVVDQLGIFEEDVPKFEEKKKAHYEGWSIADDGIEANTTPMIRFNNFTRYQSERKTRASILNKNSKIVITGSGAGALEVTTISIMPAKGQYLSVGGALGRA